MRIQKDTAVKGASRAFDVLEFVSKAGTAPTFPILVRELAIPKSSLFNLLATLVDRGYLQHINHNGNGYTLGPRIDELAHSMWRPENSIERIRPLLKHLSNVLNELSGYYERRGDEVVCLATEQGRQPLQYAMLVGQRVRLYANSPGKALLASMPEAELKSYLKSLKPLPYTSKTITSVAAIRKELQRTRRVGISKAVEEYLPGIGAFAVVIRDKGTPIGAVNVALPTLRLSRKLERAIRRELIAAARAFEAT